MYTSGKTNGAAFPAFYLQSANTFVYIVDVTSVSVLKLQSLSPLPRSAVFMFSRLATVLQELSGEEGPDGEAQVRHQPGNQSQL